MSRHINKIVKVTAWRESIPSSSTEFKVKRIGGATQLEITDMRISFKVERALTKTPNSCDIYISNLSGDTHADLETKPLKVQLDAGYDDEARLLFVGDLRFGMTEQDESGVTGTTLLQLGDGDRPYAHARVNRSYRGGTTVRTVLRDAAHSMGLELPPNLADDKSLDNQFVTGLASHGPARDEISRLLAPYGYHWSIENGVLRVLRDEEVSSTVAIPIDEEHGMIGTPKFGTPPKSGKPPHMTVKMLLYPELTPGDLVQLTSKDKSGKFRIEKVRHQGDTHGGQWNTEVEIKPY